MTQPTARVAIERRLQLHVLNLCLAVIAKQDGDIDKAKAGLVEEVWQMLIQAARSASQGGER